MAGTPSTGEQRRRLEVPEICGIRVRSRNPGESNGTNPSAPEKPLEDPEATLPDDDPVRARWCITLGADAEHSTLDPGATYRPRSAPGAAPLDLDGYALDEEVGRGGMGVVFRARQTCLGRDVALKMVRGEEDAQTLRDFLSEARVTGRLEHPNIVPVHELGKLPGGEPFIAMKLVEGQSWSDALRARPDDLDFHLRVLDQVCNAVAYAHSRSIVHNDLKPGNVMLGPFGEVLVMDWGLALSLAPVPGVRPRESLREPCGTPRYMPPELADGRGEEVGPETDVYLLGGILYHILCGRPPHRGKRFIDVVLAASAGKVPTLPETLPAELRALCERALQPRPADRFPDVLSLQAALRDYLAHRESLLLSAGAEAALARCASPARPAERAERYRAFALAVAEFDQALKLWPDNPEARAGRDRARAAYARYALDCGDLGLAEAQAEALDAPGELVAAIAEERLRRWKRKRARRAVAITGGVAALALLAALGVGLVWRARAVVELPVRTEPRGSAVWVDGVLHPERTPTVVPLGPGKHRLEIRQEPFFAVDREVEVAWGSITGSLEPALVHVPRFEYLTFQSDPPGARLAIRAPDGALVRSFTCPHTDTLRVGDYRLEAQLEGYRDPLPERPLTVRGSVRPRTVRITLEEHAGRVVFIGDLEEALVEIDGDGALRSAADTLRLAPGPHALRVLRRGLGTRHFAVDLAVGAARTLFLPPDEQTWSAPLLEAPHGTPLPVDLDGDGDLEVVLATREHLVCLARDGTLRWRHAFDRAAQVSAPLALDVDGDGLPEIVCDRRDLLVCLDGDGRVLWERRDLALPGRGTLCLADLGDGPVPVAALRDGVACLERDGSVRWFRPLDWTPSTRPVACDGGLLLACDEGLLRLAEDGTELWRSALGALVHPPARGDLGGDGAAEIVCASDDGFLLCTDDRGRERWRFPLEEPGAPALADVDGDGRLEVLVGGGDGLLCLTAEGALRWEAPAAYGIPGELSVVDLEGDPRPEIVGASDDDSLFVWSPDGRRRYELALGGGLYHAPSVCDLSGDGEPHLLIASERPGLRALRWQPPPRWLRPEQPTAMRAAGAGVAVLGPEESARWLDHRGEVVRDWEAPGGRLFAFEEDGALVFASTADGTRAYDSTGAALWEGELSLRDSRLWGSGRLQQDGGTVRLIGADTELWSRRGRLLAEAPQRLLVRAPDSTLMCLDADGAIVWRDPAPALHAAFVGARTVVQTWAGLRGLGPDGALLWELDEPAPTLVQTAPAPPLAFADRFVYGSSRGVLCRDAAGRELWALPAASARGLLGLLPGGLCYASDFESLWLFDADGRPGPVLHLPLCAWVAPPRLIDLDGDGTRELVGLLDDWRRAEGVVAAFAPDGTLRARLGLARAIGQPLLVLTGPDDAGRRLLVVADMTHLYAFDAAARVLRIDWGPFRQSVE